MQHIMVGFMATSLAQSLCSAQKVHVHGCYHLLDIHGLSRKDHQLSHKLSRELA